MIKNLLAIALVSISFSWAYAQNSVCNPAVNAHSFACSQDTFVGKIFPLFKINERSVSGPWKLLTFSPVDNMAGPEFDMMVRNNNPNLPSGVINLADHSRAGGLMWTPGNVTFLNWSEAGLNITQRRIFFRDPTLIEVQLEGASRIQVFQCRMFARKNAPHLLCRWLTAEPNGTFIPRGYLGFIR